MEREETYSDYDHSWARRAISEFKRQIPQKGGGFDGELRDFVLRLYRKAGGGAPFFLDKTPRYHLIASDILDLFPGARALILWRNPLSIIASIINTWGGGGWNLHRYRVDLYRGLSRLVDLAQQDLDNVETLRYEDLVTDQRETWNDICQHLGVSGSKLDRSPPTIEGPVGDPKQEKYEEVTASSIDNWRNVLNNPYRKIRVKKYIDWIGSDRLSEMGYKYDNLIEGLEGMDIGYNNLLRDVVSYPEEILWNYMECSLYKDKLESDSRFIISHR